MFRPAAVLAALLAAATCLVCAACGSATAGDPASGAGSLAGSGAPGNAAVLPVVASTNVWGDIAAQIGGRFVSVVSLIDDPSQDPHEFQPSGRDELAVSRAAVVIANGGGYDDFIGQMLSSVGHGQTVVTATVVAAHVPGVTAENEHVWLDPDAAIVVANAIAEAFATRDPARATAFHAAARTFAASLEPVTTTLAGIAERDAGTPVAVTEPLPLYLVAAAGLDNVTPEKFTEAVEEGIDVSPTDLATVLSLFEHHRVKLLLFNEQAASGQSEQVLGAAKRAGIGVLPLTEILPAGDTYQQWLRQLADSLSRLLAEAAQQ